MTKGEHEINTLNLKQPLELSGTKETFGIIDSSCENYELKANLRNNLIAIHEWTERTDELYTMVRLCNQVHRLLMIV